MPLVNASLYEHSTIYMFFSYLALKKFFFFLVTVCFKFKFIDCRFRIFRARRILTDLVSLSLKKERKEGIEREGGRKGEDSELK